MSLVPDSLLPYCDRVAEKEFDSPVAVAGPAHPYLGARIKRTASPRLPVCFGNLTER